MFYITGKYSLPTTMTVVPSHLKASTTTPPPPVCLPLSNSAVVRIGLLTVVVPPPAFCWPSVILGVVRSPIRPVMRRRILRR